ncbi:MAG: hypothetical protein JRN16_03325 [Nitrososphaerota archaeon]|nr:hypothetical protein [Nitrososphaerota archaeon]MDG7019317.1 hypothetical protein [Nitrososphaerota archaeon]MDG7027425.1 hypothetical protein [Nitrososphaerota archaeon]
MGAIEETREKSPGRSTRLAVVAVFTALVAMGTLFSVPIPPPVFEIIWSPIVFLTLAYFTDPATSFTATALGGFLGEALNVAYKAGGSPIYPFGMVWATGPEILFVYWARKRGTKTLALAMVAATVYETLGFFLSDWAFYAYGLFGYGSPTDAATAFWTAFPDIPSTMFQVVYVPVVLYIIKVASPAFKRLGFG